VGYEVNSSRTTSNGFAPMPDPIHAHCFVPGTDTTGAPLVLLHGSGGNEFDLMPLVCELAPKAAKIGIRGTVAIDGGFAFFHRFPDRRVNEADISARTPVLADFIEATCAYHNYTGRPIAVGFSNGAIMAAALLLTHPGLLAGVILFRPLSPFTHDGSHRLNNTPVLIIDGEKDGRRSPGDGLRLAGRLVRVGALVTHHVLPVGHAITADDKRIASDWLRAISAG
jgi:phospholipase/carboxylesterase